LAYVRGPKVRPDSLAARASAPLHCHPVLLVDQRRLFDECLRRRFGERRQTGLKTLSKDTGYVVAILDSNPIQNFTVRVESRCWFSQSADSRVPSKVYFNAFLKIYGCAVPQMTLNVVRGVFGTETRNTIEDPITPHGYAYTPIENRQRRLLEQTERESIRSSD
jgi:hypothetical protein